MSVTNIDQQKSERVVRRNARERLQQAALELFAEHGFDHTTAAEIAARAGVTERTFFRYFSDKREVLFDGEAILRDGFIVAISQAPDNQSPLSTLHSTFCSMIPTLENNRPFAAPRQAIIEATPALREREAAKLEALCETLTDALRARGIAEMTAFVAARAGMAAFVFATTSWLSDESMGLAERLDDSFKALRSSFEQSDS